MPRAPLALVLAAVLAAACQSSSTPEPRLVLADEVDRVAELLERDQPCRALDVAEALPVQDEALEDPVRNAVDDFVRQLGQTVQCPPPPPTPTDTSTPTPDPEPEPPADEDDDEDDKDDKDDDKDDRGPPDDRGRGNGNGPGGGNGNGQGNN